MFDKIDGFIKIHNKIIYLVLFDYEWFDEIQGWTNSFLGARFFGCAILLAHPIVHAKGGWSEPKCLPHRDTTRNIFSYSLFPKQEPVRLLR